MEKEIFTIKENTLSYGRGYVYSLQYHLFALLRGEGAHGKVQRGDAGAFSGGAELQKHSHIVGLGLYDWFEIAHGDEVSSELTGDVCGVV